ncbi:MAG: DUF1858 domain-containing protein, partial [Bacteroidota bacterium]|nr:DUF1858 domain-containing protein [Bacteroidota bacterium]
MKKIFTSIFTWKIISSFPRQSNGNRTIMLIDEQTKIAVLLRHHPDALETIIRLSPNFKKLRNPVLRKLMAGRTRIAMSAKIGGCHPEDFFKKLEPLGFEVYLQTAVAEETS